jgi:hypothetical protein
VRHAIRARHYSPRTEETYVHWIKRFIFFHNKRHPVEMAEKEIGRFLSSLASDAHVSASTQNQALNAILFLYREVLRKENWLRRRRCPGQEAKKAACGTNQAGGQKAAGAAKRYSVVDGDAALRRWTSFDGMLPLESQRY